MAEEPRGNFPPSEIELTLEGMGTFLFRLPAARLARLQELRGMKVFFPDGSTGVRPKAIGTIWREHFDLLGITYSDLGAADYNVGDSDEIIRQGFLGGGRGSNAEGQPVKVDAPKVAELMKTIQGTEDASGWPLHERWKLATAILQACCVGFKPAGEKPPGDEDPGNAVAAETGTSSSTSPPR